MKGTVKKLQCFIINMPQLDNYSNEGTFISFPSFEEFCKLAYIELLFKKLEIVKTDEGSVRKYLKRINENVVDCEYMMIYTNQKASFQNLLNFTYVFLCKMKFHKECYEYEKDLQEEIYKRLIGKLTLCSPSYLI